ncbi:MAG: hypothetical protein C0409_09170, partial [Novosphingobium sp.]|nr:hypothetical protein [Novosphingobium sp.]
MRAALRIGTGDGQCAGRIAQRQFVFDDMCSGGFRQQSQPFCPKRSGLVGPDPAFGPAPLQAQGEGQRVHDFGEGGLGDYRFISGNRARHIAIKRLLLGDVSLRQRMAGEELVGKLRPCARSLPVACGICDCRALQRDLRLDPAVEPLCAQDGVDPPAGKVGIPAAQRQHRLAQGDGGIVFQFFGSRIGEAGAFDVAALEGNIAPDAPCAGSFLCVRLAHLGKEPGKAPFGGIEPVRQKRGFRTAQAGAGRGLRACHALVEQRVGFGQIGVTARRAEAFDQRTGEHFLPQPLIGRERETCTRTIDGDHCRLFQFGLAARPEPRLNFGRQRIRRGLPRFPLVERNRTRADQQHGQQQQPWPARRAPACSVHQTTSDQVLSAQIFRPSPSTSSPIRPNSLFNSL